MNNQESNIIKDFMGFLHVSFVFLVSLLLSFELVAWLG